MKYRCLRLFMWSSSGKERFFDYCLVIYRHWFFECIHMKCSSYAWRGIDPWPINKRSNYHISVVKLLPEVISYFCFLQKSKSKCVDILNGQFTEPNEASGSVRFVQLHKSHCCWVYLICLATVKKIINNFANINMFSYIWEALTFMWALSDGSFRGKCLALLY